jgi:hypothetical protein
VAIVVVLVLVVVLAVLYEGGHLTPSNTGSGGGGGGGGTAAQVDITNVNWDLTGSSCSGDASQSTTAGEVVTAGSTISATETLVNNGLLGSCTFQDPSVTAGFTVASSNAPVTVNAGGTQTLEMQIVTPSTSFTGVLTVSLSVTTAI